MTPANLAALQYEVDAIRNSVGPFINLNPIHQLCALLPLLAESTDKSVEQTLDAISAACFHAVSPMREATAEDWYGKHQRVQEKRPSILAILNLTQPVDRRD